MKTQFLTVAVTVLMAAPMLHAQTTPAPAPANAPMTAGPHHGHDRMMKELGLSTEQQAQMKAIHAKYAPQMQSARAASKPDFDAMKAARTSGDTAAIRAARAKLQSDMAPTQKVHQQEMAEARAILTPAQQQKFDAHREQMKDHMGKTGHGGWMHKHPAAPVG